MMKNPANKSFIQGNTFCVFNRKAINHFTPDMLDPDYWQQKKAIAGTAQGRGITWFIDYIANDSSATQHWVLRHYYRGGVIGKFNKDSYCYKGVKKTRAAREYSLLSTMQSLALPAPNPIAYRIIKHGVLYKADLLSSRIEHANNLVAILSLQSLPDNLWLEIGAIIKKFHNNGIYHHDLNAHNILINDKQQVFLIDFDQGELRTKNNHKFSRWKKSNLSRLKRSFEKELKKLPVFNFSQNNWQVLLTGYQADESI